MKTLKEIYTGKIYADEEVMAAAPRNKVQGELVFFNISKYISDTELEKEYESRGLIPADMYALANWCEANRYDERKYFATHWQDANGKWCFAAFYRWNDERSVSVDRRDGNEWDDDWFFAGVRKGTQSSDTETSALVPLDLERAISIVKEAGYKIFKEH